MARNFAIPGSGRPRSGGQASNNDVGISMHDMPFDDRGVDFGAMSSDEPRAIPEPRTSPLTVLDLRKERILYNFRRRMCYRLVHLTARVLPAAVIYGGTLGLIVCAICRYRMGVLLSLTLFSVFSLHQSFCILVFSLWGLLKVMVWSRENWRSKYLHYTERKEESREEERQALTMGAESQSELGWEDVIHVVIVPSYKTPAEILSQSVRALDRYSLAKTNMGVVLAMEAREKGAALKADDLRREFAGRFKFVLATFHPEGLEGHVPGKSSNECWAFNQLVRELEQGYGISPHDFRVVITVIDDDSEVHESYFDALTYGFLVEDEKTRYTTTWQAPICHFKNYLRQPMFVRLSAVGATLNELSCLANPSDCHVPYSSYSLSLVLASAVGGWDPQYLAEDWHMFAKCSLKTAGRMNCRPIFLPLLNYTPEADTYWGTMRERWTQACRHALGVSEVVYLISTAYLALLEVGSFRSSLVLFWRISPLLAKFTQVHFFNAMGVLWCVFAQLVIHLYMYRSWCYVSSLEDRDGTCIIATMTSTERSVAADQIVLNSWMVYFQQRASFATVAMSLALGVNAAIYFDLVKDRIEGDVNANCIVRSPILHWAKLQLETAACGLISCLVYGTAPIWIAVLKVVGGMRFTHVVAGLVGRSDNPSDI